MTAVAKQIVLPPDVYDALELSALAFGGIGSGMFNDYDAACEIVAPRCIIGHVAFISAADNGEYGEVSEALADTGIHVRFNDRLFEPGEDRISWDEYCRRGNIVRGEDQ